MTDDATNELQKMSRENLYALWEIAKSGNLDELSGEDKWLAKVMLEHQDKFFNQFEVADITYDHEYDVDSEENPFLHISLHAAVENQLEAKDPIEAYQFYNALRKKRISHHDTIHYIAAILAPLMLHAMRQRKEFNLDMYKSLLKRYKNKRPSKIYDSMKKDFDPLFQE